jgi:SAM-dependent methyltransferase
MNDAVPNVARMYDYYLGGTEAHAVDRDAAEKVLAAAPHVRAAVLENRGFLERAVAFLAARGIDQFLDLGSGLPTRRNVHEILADIAPGSRVVYVDHDPDVVTRGRELLAGEGTAICLRGDIRQLPRLVTDPAVRGMIDFTRPVGVLALAVLNFVGDEDDPAGIIQRLRRLVPAGSLLALSHGARPDADPVADGVERVYQRASGQAVLRTREELTWLLKDCEPLPPGLVYANQWTADPARPLPGAGTAMTLAAVVAL